ncbi:MAG: class I SAM-dependent methyltransferase [Gammaproteobacteria bacterium]|nr:MAG: class I SAM-dependent methyltransferase [Gammaproteobacteria bacterium]
MNDLAHRFGRRRVDPEERTRLIRDVFRRVAPRYDLMNDLMSLGIHRYWKRVLVHEAEHAAPRRVLDLAGGTGDVAWKLARGDRAVDVCDPSLPMMQVGRRRGPANRIGWVGGCGERLPFRDQAFDLVTIAFGIRNVTHLDVTLQEIRRVLRPGGRLLCLEFSRPAPWLAPFYDLYSRLVIPRLGAWVSRNPDAYLYLIDSIRAFPDQETLAEHFRAAGFTGVRYHNLSFGIACIHQGVRPPGDAS